MLTCQAKLTSGSNPKHSRLRWHTSCHQCMLRLAQLACRDACLMSAERHMQACQAVTRWHALVLGTCSGTPPTTSACTTCAACSRAGHTVSSADTAKLVALPVVAETVHVGLSRLRWHAKRTLLLQVTAVVLVHAHDQVSALGGLSSAQRKVEAACLGRMVHHTLGQPSVRQQLRGCREALRLCPHIDHLQAALCQAALLFSQTSQCVQLYKPAWALAERLHTQPWKLRATRGECAASAVWPSTAVCLTVQAGCIPGAHLNLSALLQVSWPHAAQLPNGWPSCELLQQLATGFKSVLPCMPA